MRPSTLLWLWWMRLRARWATELLAAIGIAAGVALLFAALVANASMSGSVEALTRGVIGNAQLQLIARGPDGMPEALAARASRLDAIRAAAPVIEHRVGVVGPDGRAWVTLLGGDARFAAMSGGTLEQLADPELTRLRAIGLPSPIAEAIGLQPYSRVAVESGTGLAELLGVSMGAKEIGMLADSPVALTTLPVAQNIAGMRGRVSRIFLQAHPGQEDAARDQAEALAGTTADVRPGDWDAAVFRTAASPTQQSTTMFAVLAAGVGFLFAACAVLLTANRRMEFCRQLRMDGHPPRTVRAAMLLDALALGLVGAIAGLIIGDQLSRHVLDGVPGYLTTGFPIGASRNVSPAAVGITVLGALVASTAAVLLPLRQTLFPRSRRRAAIGRATVPALGVAAVLLAIAITTWWATAALAGLIALTTGLLLLLPTILHAVVALFSRSAQGIRAVAPIFAAWRLSAPSSATISRALAATGALAAFALVAIGGARDDLLRGLVSGAVAIDTNADIWITTNGPTSAYAVTPLAADRLRDALEEIDGVARVGAYHGSWLDVGERRAWIQAPPADAPAPAPPGQLRQGQLGPATAELRAGGSVILSEVIADELNAGVGDTVTLPTPAPRPLRVAAISNNLGWPSGTIILNADDYAGAWNTRTPSALLLDIDPDAASAAAVVNEVRELVAERGLPLSVQTADERVDLHRTSAREGLIRLSQITVLLAIAAALAMAAAMGGIIVQSRPAIAARKVEGFSTRQMWSALVLEAAVLVGTGCAAGAAAGLLGQVLLSRALETITGFPLDYAAAIGVAGQIVGAIVLLALTIITLLGWSAARVPASVQPQPA